ncbi:hypothetical protein [Brevibacillus centrosporus]|uniref:hypothetical protein n=1 Tax=Brevibacillus centrosporus TaxID=54910 RepID=UPI002E1C0442|nr:hypothetical protein [Brevibacillus centrosporus]
MSKKKKAVSVGGIFLVGVLAGSALMYNNSVYHSVSAAFGQGAVKNSVVQAGGQMEQVNLNSVDIEAAVMAVQNARTNQLEQQLRDQINSIQKQNEQISGLNDLNNKLNNAANKSTDDKAPDQPIDMSDDEKKDLLDGLKANGLEPQGDLTEDEIRRLAGEVKKSIDQESNSQQQEMLRLQSLSNKRNEAFDTMTEFIKKMQDSRGTIIGNMR